MEKTTDTKAIANRIKELSDKYATLDNETTVFVSEQLEEIVREYGITEEDGTIVYTHDSLIGHPIELGTATMYPNELRITKYNELVVNGDDDYNDYSIEVDSLNGQNQLELLKIILSAL